LSILKSTIVFFGDLEPYPSVLDVLEDVLTWLHGCHPRHQWDEPFFKGNSLAVVRDDQDYPENVKEIIRQVQAYIFTRRIRVKAPLGAPRWRTFTAARGQKSSGGW
jgi:hypothetical protein